MNVSLSKHFEEFVANMVASGRYSNASEVIRDGLRKLEDETKAEVFNPEVDTPELAALLKERVKGPHVPYVPGEFTRMAEKKITEFRCRLNKR